MESMPKTFMTQYVKIKKSIKIKPVLKSSQEQ